jgi:pyruvate-formate lyase-activating enzyme
MARSNTNTGKAQAAAQRQLEALEYRKAGLPLRAIAGKLGVSHTQIATDIKTVMAVVLEECKESADELILLEVERLDGILLNLRAKAIKGDVRANAELRKVSESRRKLLGLDKPVKISPTTPDGKKPYVPVDYEELAKNMDPAELFRKYREATGETGDS